METLPAAMLLLLMLFAGFAEAQDDDTFRVKVRWSRVEWKYTAGDGLTGDYELSGRIRSVTVGGEHVLQPRNQVETCDTSSSTCAKLVSRTANPVSIGKLDPRTTTMKVSYDAWEEDCGNRRVFDGCRGGVEFDDVLVGTTTSTFTISNTKNGVERGFTTIQKRDIGHYEITLRFVWTVDPLKRKGCMRAYERASRVGDYENLCSSGAAVPAGTSSVDVGPQTIAVLHSSQEGKSLVLPSPVVGFNLGSRDFDNEATSVTFHDALVEVSNNNNNNDNNPPLPVNVGECGELPSPLLGGTGTVTVSTRRFVSDDLYACFFTESGCVSGARRCVRLKSVSSAVRLEATLDLQKHPMAAVRAVQVVSEPGVLSFNLMDPEKVPILASGQDGSAWVRDSSQQPPASWLASCHGKRMPVAQSLGLRVPQAAAAAECAGCFALAVEQEGGGEGFLHVDEDTGELVESSTRHTLFAAHSNGVLGVTVLEVVDLVLAEKGERLFVVPDVFQEKLLLRSSPLSECGMLMDDTRTQAAATPTSVVVDSLRGAETAQDLALRASSPGFPFRQFDMAADEFCSAAAAAAQTIPNLCALQQLKDLGGEAGFIVRMGRSRSVDLTAFQNVRLDQVIEDAQERREAEQGVNRILEQLRRNQVGLKEELGTVTQNMQVVAGSWGRVQEKSAGFEQDLVEADFAASWNLVLSNVDDLPDRFAELAEGVEKLSEDVVDKLRKDYIGGLFSFLIGGPVLFDAFNNIRNGGSSRAAVGLAVDPSLIAEGIDKMTSAIGGLIAARKALARAEELKEEAGLALEEMAAVVERVGKTLLGLLELDGAISAIRQAGESGSGSEDPPMQEAFQTFLAAYEGFDGGNVVSVSTVARSIRLIVDELCGLGGSRFSAACSGVSSQLDEVEDRMVAGIEEAYETATSMGHWARLQLELVSLKEFQEEVERLPFPGGDEVLLEEADFAAAAFATFYVRDLKQAVALHKLAVQRCAMQRYVNAGLMSGACRKVVDDGELAITGDALSEVRGTAVGATVRNLVFTAGLPTAPESVGTSRGFIDVHELLTSPGRWQKVQIPQDEGWLKKYGWKQASGAAFFRSMVIEVPLTNASGVRLNLEIKFDREQPVVGAAGGRDAFRRDMLRIQSGVNAFDPCDLDASDEVSTSPYGHCGVPFQNNCLKGTHGPFFPSEDEDLDRFLPSLHAAFSVRVDGDLSQGLEKLDPSRLPVKGGMVVAVRSEVRTVSPPPTRRQQRSIPALQTTREAAAAAACCPHDQFNGDWADTESSACLPCPEGSSSASTGGVFCLKN